MNCTFLGNGSFWFLHFRIVIYWTMSIGFGLFFIFYFDYKEILDYSHLELAVNELYHSWPRPLKCAAGVSPVVCSVSTAMSADFGFF